MFDGQYAKQILCYGHSGLRMESDFYLTYPLDLNCSISKRERPFNAFEIRIHIHFYSAARSTRRALSPFRDT